MPTYTVVSVKERLDKKTNQQYQDTYGNKRWYVMVNDEKGSPWSTGYTGKKVLKKDEVLENVELVPREYNGTTYYDLKFEKKEFSGGGFKPEDPQKQIAIIRQSSLKAAIDFFSGTSPDHPTTDDILAVAEKFAYWVQNPKKVVRNEEPVEEDPIEELPF